MRSRSAANIGKARAGIGEGNPCPPDPQTKRPQRGGPPDWSVVVGGVSMLTSLLGLVLLIASFFVG